MYAFQIDADWNDQVLPTLFHPIAHNMHFHAF